MEARGRPTDRRSRRHSVGVARTIDPGGRHDVRRLSAGDRLRRTLPGVYSVAFGGTRVLLFITGAISLVLAILSFRHFGDTYAILLLSLWVGVGLIFQGVSEVGVAVGEEHLPGRGWYVILGIFSVLAGIVVLVWPFDSIVVLVLAVGIALIVIGVVHAVQALQTHKDAKTLREAVDSVSKRSAAG